MLSPWPVMLCGDAVRCMPMGMQASNLGAAHTAMGSDVCALHENTYGEWLRRVRAHASKTAGRST